MDDRLIIVSSDSHATVPVELWPEYFEQRYHEHLPQMQYESDLYASSVWPLSKMVLTQPDVLEDHTTGGWRGVFDLDIRLQQMDREGIAAELVNHGDARCGELGCNVTNSVWPFEVWDAGARAYNRWAADTFGSATDRVLLTSAIGSCSDIDATVAELRWIAAHGFVATFVPGFLRHPDLPPLFDPYWEPVWDVCEEAGIALVVHAGFGFEQGLLYDSMERVHREVADAEGSEMDLVMKLATEVFTGEFFSDTRARRPMWQLMFGGVFDRHPKLKLLMTEVRLDWIPATIAHLDALYDEHRGDVPALRKPSEYWREHCLAGASFVHKVEVEMRHDIGVENILFGRDYPHPEGTWPNTPDWIRDAFAGVPEPELRLMLGETAIPFLGLDKAALGAIAARIGPTVQEVAGPNPAVDAEVLAMFDGRGGYLRDAEGDGRIAEIEPALRADLEGLARV
jgi:predicted TIM-barrel fold metal-dependent hydrolase